MEDRTCESCRNRHDCKSREAFERLRGLCGGQGLGQCSGYEHEEQALNGDYEDFVNRVRNQIARTLDIPLAVLDGSVGDAEKSRKERFIERLEDARVEAPCYKCPTYQKYEIELIYNSAADRPPAELPNTCPCPDLLKWRSKRHDERLGEPPTTE